MTSNGSVEYYNKTDGKFYRIDKNNQITALSDKVFHDVQNIVWSPTSDKAVIEYPDGSKIVYDFTSKKQTTLPKHWEDFNFSPDGQTLVMKSMGIDTETRYLAISSSDGSSQKIIDTIGDNGNNIYPSWSPNNEIIAMDVEGVDADRQEVYFVGLNDENFKSTIIEGRGFQSTWSTSGDKLLYSVYSSTSDYKPSLWIVNAQGDNIGTGRTSLNINTWASKCTFTSNETVYCGVPESLDTGSGLIPEMAQNSKDDLYKINVATGNKELVAVPNGSYNMSNLSVSPDGTSLYFTDANDSKLHKVTLK
jgi:dipeptidyl aminopeptidase/acylaminoacyl peptidase